MTDLTNRTAEEVNALIQKYATLLEVADAKKREDLPILAIIFDVGINYIKTTHNDLSRDWKAWSMLVVKHKYSNGKIKTEEEVRKTIDDFIAFWKAEYKNYCNDIISATEYDRDRGFVFRFLLKKIGGN